MQIRNVILAVLLVWLVCSAPGCVYDPNYEGTHCGPAQSCPDGYRCEPVQKICVKEGSGPEEPQPDGDGGPDADDGADDGGLDDGDDGMADDGGLDDGGDDGGPADQGPCGGCPVGHWCDDDTCRLCNNPEHCGDDCVQCQAGESCNNLGPHGFCCEPECVYELACNRHDCNGHAYLCKAFFDPLITYLWIPLDEFSAAICALSDQDSIVAELFQCNPQNDEELWFFCPWNGTCHEDGTCQPDEAYAFVHHCGSQWGCDVDHCRIHLKEGTSCLFNYDCQSFCCSRDANAVCLDGSNRDLCKISKSLYIIILAIDVAVFEANGPDPHDLSAWASTDSNSSPHCDSDQECDSGHCRYFSAELIFDYRCELAGCVNTDDDQGTRDTYFCEDPIHDSKINNLLWPDTPADCVYEQ